VEGQITRNVEVGLKLGMTYLFRGDDKSDIVEGFSKASSVFSVLNNLGSMPAKTFLVFQTF
jgi:hypothetical protein